MSYRDELRAEPFRFDFLATLRELERSYPRKPRIGDSAVVSEDVVYLGQDPYLEFPASNITSYQDTPSGIPKVLSRFLGFFGPQGALPLTTTVEAFTWTNQRDSSFARFVDIFANRFLQLFFRAWADARPIAQHDRPAQDRFFRYVGSMAGIGSDAWLGRDSVEDIAKVSFAGLVGARVKSVSRLRQLISGVLGVETRVEERIGSWLTFEPGDRMALGAAGCSLGQDAFLGARSYSINEKIRICLKTRDLDQYRAFLPTGSLSDKLTDLVFFYLGHRFDFDIQLSLPARHAPPAKLGVSGELGWTSWISPKAPGDDVEIYLSDARFSPIERRLAAEAELGRKSRRASARTGGTR